VDSGKLGPKARGESARSLEKAAQDASMPGLQANATHENELPGISARATLPARAGPRGWF